jgi:hypothetical protein
VRKLTLTRRLLGGALIAVALATSSAPHNHALGEFVGAFSAGGEHAVTTHDPHSRASHWHAVIRFVKEEPCLACQWHRLSGASLVAGFMPPILSPHPAEHFVPTSLRSPSLGQPSSRAPPDLL